METRWVAAIVLCLLASPLEAQSTGTATFVTPPRRASSLVLDVGGFLHAGTESADLYTVSATMPFRLEGSIQVARLGPRLALAAVGWFGGVYDARLVDSLAAGRSFLGDLWAVTNPLTGVRLFADASDSLRLVFGLDLVWPGRDVHEAELGTTTEAEHAVAAAQGLDSWDPFLYQGSYVHVATRFELEARVDSSFVGGELGAAVGLPASSRAGWTTVCGELGLYVGTRITPEVAIGLRAHAAVVDDGPRVVSAPGGYLASDRAAYGLAALAPFLRIEHDAMLAELRAFLDFISDRAVATPPGPVGWSIHTRLGVRFDTHP